MPTRTAAAPTNAPCPECGYDLRGHADQTVCPECGRSVRVTTALAESFRWLDAKLLDLWSIAVLLSVGSACQILTLIAIRFGQYEAVLLGVMAVLCISTAGVWLLATSLGVARRGRRPVFRSVARAGFRRLVRWWVVNALLMALATALLSRTAFL